MRQKATRASTTTQLVLGAVTAEVALLKTTGDPEKLPEFVRAGPSGGELRKESRLVRAVEAPKADPLGTVAASATAETWTAFQDTFDPDVNEDAAEYRDVLVEDGTGYVVGENEEVRRGIRDEFGMFIDLSEHLVRIEAETKLEAMRVEAFIRVEQVPRERVTGSYYLATSDGNGAKVLRLVYEAMRKTKRVAVVKLTKRTRQSLGVIVPHGATGTLMLLELAWDAQWREPGSRALQHLTPAADVSFAEVEAAIRLVEALSDSRVALDEMEDDAVRLRTDLVGAALDGELLPVTPETAERPAPDVSLMGMLLYSAERVE